MTTPSQRRQNAEAAKAALAGNSSLNSVSGASKNSYGDGGNVYNPNSNFSALYNQVANANAAASDVNLSPGAQALYNYGPASTTAYNSTVNNPSATPQRRATDLEKGLKAAWDWGEDVSQNTRFLGKNSGEAWQSLSDQVTGKKDFNVGEAVGDLASFGATLVPSMIGGLAQDPAKAAMAGGGADIANMNTGTGTISNEKLSDSQRLGYATDVGVDALGFIPGIGPEARAAATLAKIGKVGAAATKGTVAAAESAAKTVGKANYFQKAAAKGASEAAGDMNLLEKAAMGANKLSEKTPFKNLGYNTVTGLASMADEGIQEGVQGVAQQFEENKDQKWDNLDWNQVASGVGAGMLGGGMFHAATTAANTANTAIVNSTEAIRKKAIEQSVSNALANSRTNPTSIYASTPDARSDADAKVLQSDIMDYTSNPIADMVDKKMENARKKNNGVTATAINDDTQGGSTMEVDDVLVAQTINRSRGDSGDYVAAADAAAKAQNNEDLYTDEMKATLRDYMPHETQKAIEKFKASHPEVTEVTYKDVLPTERQRKWGARVQQAYDNNGRVETKDEQGNITSEDLNDIVNEIFDGESRMLPALLNRSPFTNEGPVKVYIKKFKRGNYANLGRLAQDAIGGDNDGDLVSHIKSLRDIHTTPEAQQSINVKLAKASKDRTTSVTNGVLAGYWERAVTAARLGVNEITKRRKKGKYYKDAEQGVANSANLVKATLNASDFYLPWLHALERRRGASDVVGDVSKAYKQATLGSAGKNLNTAVEGYIKTVARYDGKNTQSVEDAAIRLHKTLYEFFKQFYTGTDYNYNEFYDYIVESARNEMHTLLQIKDIAYKAYNDVSTKGSTSAELEQAAKEHNVRQAMAEAAQKETREFNSSDTMATPYNMGGAINDAAKGQLASEMTGGDTNLDVDANSAKSKATLIRESFQRIVGTKDEPGLNWGNTIYDMTHSELMAVLYSLARGLNGIDHTTVKTASTIFRTSMYHEFEANYREALNDPENADLVATYGRDIYAAPYNARIMYGTDKTARKLRDLVYKTYADAYRHTREAMQEELSAYLREQTAATNVSIYMQAILPAELTHDAQAYFYMMKDCRTETYLGALKGGVELELSDEITKFCALYPTLGDVYSASGALYTGDVLDTDSGFSAVAYAVAQNADSPERSAFVSDLRAMSRAYAEGKERGLTDTARLIASYVYEYVYYRESNPEYAAMIAGKIYAALSALNPQHYLHNGYVTLEKFITEDPVFRRLVAMMEKRSSRKLSNADLDEAVNLMYSTQLDAMFDPRVPVLMEDGTTVHMDLRKWASDLQERLHDPDQAAEALDEARVWLAHYGNALISSTGHNPYADYFMQLLNVMLDGVEGGPLLNSMLNHITAEQAARAIDRYIFEWDYFTSDDAVHNMAEKQQRLADFTMRDVAETPWYAYAYVGLGSDIDMSDLQTVMTTIKTQYVSEEYIKNRAQCLADAHSLFGEDNFRKLVSTTKEVRAVRGRLRSMLDINNTVELEPGVATDYVMDMICNIPKQQMDKGASSPAADREAQTANMAYWGQTFRTLIEQYQEPLVGSENLTLQSIQNPMNAARVMKFLLLEQTDTEAKTSTMLIDGMEYTQAELWRELLGDAYKNDFVADMTTLTDMHPEFVCAAFQRGRLVTTQGAQGIAVRYSNVSKPLMDLYTEAGTNAAVHGSASKHVENKLLNLTELSSAMVSLNLALDSKSRLHPDYLNNRGAAAQSLRRLSAQARDIVAAKVAKVYLGYLVAKQRNPQLELSQYIKDNHLDDWVHKNLAVQLYDGTAKALSAYCRRGESIWDHLNNIINRQTATEVDTQLWDMVVEDPEVQQALEDIRTDSEADVDAYLDTVLNMLVGSDSTCYMSASTSILEILLMEELDHNATGMQSVPRSLDEVLAERLLRSTIVRDVKTKLTWDDAKLKNIVLRAVQDKLADLQLNTIKDYVQPRQNAIRAYFTALTKKLVYTDQSQVMSSGELRIYLMEQLEALYSKDAYDTQGLPLGYDLDAMENFVAYIESVRSAESLPSVEQQKADVYSYAMALATSCGMHRIAAAEGGKNFDLNTVGNIDRYADNLVNELEALVESYDIMYNAASADEQAQYANALNNIINKHQTDSEIDAGLRRLANTMDFTTDAQNNLVSRGNQGKQNQDQSQRAGNEGNAPYVFGTMVAARINTLECDQTSTLKLEDLDPKATYELVLTDEVLNLVRTAPNLSDKVRNIFGDTAQPGGTVRLTQSLQTELAAALKDVELTVYSSEDACGYGACKHHHPRVGLDARRFLSDSQEKAGFKLMKKFRPTLSMVTGELNRIIVNGEKDPAVDHIMQQLQQSRSDGMVYFEVSGATTLEAVLTSVLHFNTQYFRPAVSAALLSNAKQNEYTKLDSFTPELCDVCAAMMTEVHVVKLPALRKHGDAVEQVPGVYDTIYMSTTEMRQFLQDGIDPRDAYQHGQDADFYTAACKQDPGLYTGAQVCEPEILPVETLTSHFWAATSALLQQEDKSGVDICREASTTWSDYNGRVHHPETQAYMDSSKHRAMSLSNAVDNVPYYRRGSASQPFMTGADQHPFTKRYDAATGTTQEFLNTARQGMTPRRSTRQHGLPKAETWKNLVYNAENHLTKHPALRQYIFCSPGNEHHIGGYPYYVTNYISSREAQPIFDGTSLHHEQDHGLYTNQLTLVSLPNSGFKAEEWDKSAVRERLEEAYAAGHYVLVPTDTSASTENIASFLEWVNPGSTAREFTTISTDSGVTYYVYKPEDILGLAHSVRDYTPYGGLSRAFDGDMYLSVAHDLYAQVVYYPGPGKSDGTHYATNSGVKRMRRTQVLNEVPVKGSTKYGKLEWYTGAGYQDTALAAVQTARENYAEQAGLEPKGTDATKVDAAGTEVMTANASVSIVFDKAFLAGDYSRAEVLDAMEAHMAQPNGSSVENNSLHVPEVEQNHLLGILVYSNANNGKTVLVPVQYQGPRTEKNGVKDLTVTIEKDQQTIRMSHYTETGVYDILTDTKKDMHPQGADKGTVRPTGTDVVVDTAQSAYENDTDTSTVEYYNDLDWTKGKLVSNDLLRRFRTMWMHMGEKGLGFNSAYIHDEVDGANPAYMSLMDSNWSAKHERAAAALFGYKRGANRAKIPEAVRQNLARKEYSDSQNGAAAQKCYWEEISKSLRNGEVVFNAERYGSNQRYIAVLIDTALNAGVNPMALLNPSGHNDLFTSALANIHYVEAIMPSYMLFLHNSTKVVDKNTGRITAYCPAEVVNPDDYHYDATDNMFHKSNDMEAYTTLGDGWYGVETVGGERVVGIATFEKPTSNHDTALGEKTLGVGFVGPSLETKLFVEGRLDMRDDDKVRSVLREGLGRYNGTKSVNDGQKVSGTNFSDINSGYDPAYVRPTTAETNALLRTFGSKWVRSNIQDAKARLHAYETPVVLEYADDDTKQGARTLEDFAREVNSRCSSCFKNGQEFTAQEWSVFVASCVGQAHLTQADIDGGAAHWHYTMDYNAYAEAHEVAMAILMGDTKLLNKYAYNSSHNADFLYSLDENPMGFYAVKLKRGNIRGEKYTPVILYLPDTIRGAWLGKLKESNPLYKHMSAEHAMEREVAKYKLCLKSIAENTKTASLGDLSHMNYVYRFMSNEVHGFKTYWQYMTYYELRKMRYTSELRWREAMQMMGWDDADVDAMDNYIAIDQSYADLAAEYGNGVYTTNTEVAGAETDVQQVHHQYIRDNQAKALRGIMMWNKATAMANPAVAVGNAIDTSKGRYGQKLALDLGEKLNVGVYKTTQTLEYEGEKYSALSDDFIDIMVNEPKIYTLMKVRKLILNSGFDNNETMAHLDAYIRSQLNEGKVPDLDGFLNELNKNGNSAVDVFGAKLYNKIMNVGSGNRFFRKTAVRNYLRLLSRLLQESQHPAVTHARRDANGNVVSELQYAMAQEDPALAFFKLMYSTAYGTNQLANIAEQQNLRAEQASDNAAAIFMDALFSRNGGTQFFLNTVLGATFPRAVININGRLLNTFLPLSALNYVVCRKIDESFDADGNYQGGILDAFLIGMPAAEKQRFVMMARKRAQGAVGALNWQEAVRLDLMRIGSLPVLALMFAALGVIQPPEDDRQKDDYEEWLWVIPGYEPQRIALSWWLKENIGPVLPLAVFWSSCFRGDYNFNIIKNGIWDMACANVFTNTGDLINAVLDPESVFETYDSDVAYYDEDNITDTSQTEYLAGNAAYLGLTYLGRVFTPGVLLEFSRDVSKYEKSYNRVYKTDANGQLIEDSQYTDKTDYIDSRVRKYTRNNVFAGLIFDVLHGFDKNTTGYMSWEMPNQIKYDSIQTKWMAENSVMEYDENGYKTDTPKNTTDQQKVCATLLYKLVTTDAKELYNEGWYLDSETKLALSNYIWDIYQDEIDRWSYLNQNGYLDRYTLSATGDYTEGMAVYSGLYNQHMTILNTIKGEWYAKLWGSDLNQGRVLYNQYNTTYKQATDGSWYSTGIKQNLTDIISPARNIAESGSVDDASRSVFGGYQYTDEGLPARALDAYVAVDSTEAPEWESLTGYRDHTSTETTTTTDTANNNNSNNTKNKYGKRSSGGGYSRRSGGGSSSYLRSVSNGGTSYRNNISHSNLSPATQQATGIMGARRIYDTSLDYLRPAVETKGSRQAYKREDI